LLPFNDLPALNNGQNVTLLYHFYEEFVHVSVKNLYYARRALGSRRRYYTQAKE